MNTQPILDMFNGSLSEGQQNGINAVLTEWDWYKADNTDIRHLAYILATIFHETGRKMQPVKEGGSEAYLRSKPYYPFIGRGLVQITWEDNYKKFGKILNVDLVNNPDLALDKKIAIDITFIGMIHGLFRKRKLSDGSFANEKLSDYFNENREDWVLARNIINGTKKGEKLPDRAEDIAEYAKAFFQALT